MKDSRFSGYDIIGDVHGCAISLRILLNRLGYVQRQGVYQHPVRQAIFVGDIIDRGPHIREALHLVRDMVEAGHAQIVMGNHEYNYICYTTPAPSGFAQPYLRKHTPRNYRILEATLEQLANYPDDQRDFLNWFEEMPVFLEFNHFRVVHACWHQQLIDRFIAMNDGNRMRRGFLFRSAVGDSQEHDIMDILLRGTHLELPNKEIMISKDGFERSFFRTKFWLRDPYYLNDVVFQPDPLPAHMAKLPLTREQRSELIGYRADNKPLFIGHYWCQGEPEPLAPNVACLDYSAVKFGKLVAYRMDEETRIQKDKFVWVDVAREVAIDE